MQKKFLLLFVILYAEGVSSQTFRAAFDKLDKQTTQYYSLISNVTREQVNLEPYIMRSYINMYKATKDKHYLDKFIIHAKRVQDRASETLKDDSIPSKFFLCAFFSPTYTFATFNSEPGKKSDWEYSFGLIAGYKKYFHISWTLGITYDKLKHHATFPVDYLASTVIRTNTYEYELLNFPFSINYQTGGRVLFNTEFGIQGSILSKNQFTSDAPDYIREELFKNGTLLAIINLGCGIYYKLNRNFFLTFNASYYHALIPLVHIYYGPTRTIEEFNYLRYTKGALGLRFNF